MSLASVMMPWNVQSNPSVLRQATKLFALMFGLETTDGESLKQSTFAARKLPSGSATELTGSKNALLGPKHWKGFPGSLGAKLSMGFGSPVNEVPLGVGWIASVWSPLMLY